MAAAFRGPADRTTRSEWRLRDGGNVPSLSGAQQPPNRISLEIRAQQFESWSPCFEGDWNRRFPSLTRSGFPLPKRFHRRLVEVRVSRGRDDPNIRDVSLRIECQSETTSPRLPRQRLPGGKRRRRRVEQSG